VLVHARSGWRVPAGQRYSYSTVPFSGIDNTGYSTVSDLPVLVHTSNKCIRIRVILDSYVLTVDIIRLYVRYVLKLVIQCVCVLL
jgi:hypothetical protein